MYLAADCSCTSGSAERNRRDSCLVAAPHCVLKLIVAVTSDRSYVTIFAKINHSAQILDTESLVPRCSTLIALDNGGVRIMIAHSVPELHA